MVGLKKGWVYERMSVLIIGNRKNKEFEQLRYYLLKLEIPYIEQITTVDKAIKEILPKMEDNIYAIIYDVRLTSDTVYKVYRKLKRLRKKTNIPIILSVNKNEINLFENIFEIGIFDFIEKPYKYIHVKGRVLSAIKYRKEATLRQLKDDYSQMDLNFAKNVQYNALTPSLQMEHVQYDGLYITSNTLGGDMYCWFKINDDLSAVLLYDVMGHGIASSLVSMSIHSLLKGIITRLIDPVLVVTELNRHLYELFYNEEEMDGFLITAIYVLIDTKRGIIHYVNAAHPTGYLIGESGETVNLSSNTPILGLFPKVKVVKKTITLAKWNRIILYTDGLCTLDESKFFAASKFYPYLEQDNAQFLRKFSRDYRLFSKQHKDDISVVSITINKE